MKDTVRSLADKVVAGDMKAAEAGAKMKVLATRYAPPKSMEERRERFNEPGLLSDDNSMIHVAALYSLGLLKKADYEAINKAMDG